MFEWRNTCLLSLNLLGERVQPSGSARWLCLGVA